MRFFFFFLSHSGCQELKGCRRGQTRSSEHLLTRPCAAGPSRVPTPPSPQPARGARYRLADLPGIAGSSLRTAEAASHCLRVPSEQRGCAGEKYQRREAGCLDPRVMPGHPRARRWVGGSEKRGARKQPPAPAPREGQLCPSPPWVRSDKRGTQPRTSPGGAHTSGHRAHRSRTRLPSRLPCASCPKGDAE